MLIKWVVYMFSFLILLIVDLIWVNVTFLSSKWVQTLHKSVSSTNNNYFGFINGVKNVKIKEIIFALNSVWTISYNKWVKVRTTWDQFWPHIPRMCWESESSQKWKGMLITSNGAIVL